MIVTDEPSSSSLLFSLLSTLPNKAEEVEVDRTDEIWTEERSGKLTWRSALRTARSAWESVKWPQEGWEAVQGPGWEEKECIYKGN